MCNVGKTDKIIRIVVAVVLFAAAAMTPYWWLSIIGLVALGTALFGVCPLYVVLGINTGCEIKKD